MTSGLPCRRSGGARHGEAAQERGQGVDVVARGREEGGVVGLDRDDRAV
jgi:hypothetical protein